MVEAILVLAAPGAAIASTIAILSAVGLSFVGLLITGSRCRVEVGPDWLRIINPLRTRTLARSSVQSVTLKRLTGQLVGLRLRLLDGTAVTVVGAGPDELEEFCKATHVAGDSRF